MTTTPEIVCLCGSTRFYEAFQQANYEETMRGKIVLSVGFFMHSPQANHRECVGCTPEQKIALDELHKRKIDLADRVLVLNVGGYIGESTRSEIEYAKRAGKIVEYMEGLESGDTEQAEVNPCPLVPAHSTREKAIAAWNRMNPDAEGGKP